MRLATDEPVLNGWYGRDFISPFPSRDSQLNDKFRALREAKGGASKFAIIEQGQAFSAALGVCNAAKAVHVGDLLSDWLPKTAWMTKGVSGPLVQGLFATVPWDGNFEPKVLIENMITAGLTIALTALSAVPVYGQIATALVAVAFKLVDFFTTKGSDNEKKLLLPWTDYSEHTDEDIVDACRLGMFRTVDWNALFLPAFDLEPWAYQWVEGKGGVLMPARNYDPAFGTGFGCMPGTLKMAGHLQVVPQLEYNSRLRRFIKDKERRNDNRIAWRGATTNCGDFYPATAQLGAAVWQQANAAGNPDMYKLDAAKIERAWREYFANLLETTAELLVKPKNPSKMERLAYDSDHAYISECVESYLCWRLLNPDDSATPWEVGVPPGHRVGPFYHPKFFQDGPVAIEDRTPCLFVEEDVRDGRRRLWPYTFDKYKFPAQHPKLRASMRDYAFRGPIVGITGEVPKGYRCIPYPTAELAAAEYTTPDRVFITPATQALRLRQFACLKATLVSAYVRPEGYEGLAAYSAFLGKDDGYALTQACMDARKKLLVNEARYLVNLKDVDAIDPRFAADLRASGVNNSPHQRQKGMQLVANGAKLEEDDIPPAPGAGGGVAFGDLVPEGTGKGGGKGLAAAAAGAALLGLGLIAKSRR